MRDLHDQRELQHGDEDEVRRTNASPNGPRRPARRLPSLLGVREPLRQFLRVALGTSPAAVHALAAARDLGGTYTPQRRCFGELRQHHLSVTRPRNSRARAQQGCRPGGGCPAPPAPLPGADHDGREGVLGEEHREVRLARERIRFLRARRRPRARSAVRDVAASSGGVRSSVTFTASTMALTGSASASRSRPSSP